jgi:hypothetical protein
VGSRRQVKGREEEKGEMKKREATTSEGKRDTRRTPTGRKIRRRMKGKVDKTGGGIDQQEKKVVQWVHSTGQGLCLGACVRGRQDPTLCVSTAATPPSARRQMLSRLNK